MSALSRKLDCRNACVFHAQDRSAARLAWDVHSVVLLNQEIPVRDIVSLTPSCSISRT